MGISTGTSSKREQSLKEYCLIGLGKFNYEIGLVLLQEGHKVTVIDSDQKKIDLKGSEFHCSIVCDCTNIKDLEDLGVQHFDYVILGIEDVATSVITAANLKELYVKNIICKAKDEMHRRILKMMGINISYIPEEEVATKIAYRAMYELNVEMFSLSEDTEKNTLIMKIVVNNPHLFNKKINEIDVSKTIEATIISIKRSNGITIAPIKGEDIIEEKDEICLICKKEYMHKVKQYFTKESPESFLEKIKTLKKT